MESSRLNEEHSMSGPQDDTASNVVSIRPPEAEIILGNLRALREQIITAWSERSVMLDAEERAELRAEIRETCDFLSELTRRG